MLAGVTIALVARISISARQTEWAERHPVPHVESPPSNQPLQLPPPLKGVTYSHDAPAYGLPLVIQIDAPPVPDRIKGPSPPIPQKQAAK